MDPTKYFKQGSSGYVQTMQALSVINAAQQAGLTDEANRLRSDLEASIIQAKESGWKNFSGFDMQRKLIAESLPSQINAVVTSKNKTEEDRFKRSEDAYKEGKNLEVTANQYFGLGGTIDDQTMADIKKASDDKDPVALGAYRSMMEQKLSAARIEQAKQLDPVAMAKKQAMSDANATKERTIQVINRFINDKGKPKDILSRSTGFGEGVDRFFGGMTSGSFGSASDELVAQDTLIRDVVTDDVLQTVQLLKPASNTDIAAIQATRPGITTSPDQWAAYLQSMKNVLSQDVDPSKFDSEKLPEETAAPTQDEKATEAAKKATEAANKLKLMFPARQPAN
jgi:hypothetical protein